MNHRIYKSIWILAIILCGCSSPPVDSVRETIVVTNAGVRVSYQKLLIIENQNAFSVTIECIYRVGTRIVETEWVQLIEAGESLKMNAGSSIRPYEFRIYHDGTLLGFIKYNLKIPNQIQ